MIQAWRIAKRRFAASAFDGEGARLTGGRWNSIGTPVAYASDSVALATLEVLVGLQDSALLSSYSLIEIEFAEELEEVLDVRMLPRSWNQHPPSPETGMLGDLWVAEARSVVLKVPSAVVEAEYNYVLNPRHPQFSQVRIHRPTPYRLDPRLLG